MFSLSSGESRHLIVFDLEWNQSSYNPNHRMPHEIIEIGACRVDREYRVVDTFSRLIRPRLYKRLDKHIKKVTGITEEELEAGGAFADVFADFIHWAARTRSSSHGAGMTFPYSSAMQPSIRRRCRLNRRLTRSWCSAARCWAPVISR